MPLRAHVKVRPLRHFVNQRMVEIMREELAIQYRRNVDSQEEADY